jgi:hypothetical protein
MHSYLSQRRIGNNVFRHSKSRNKWKFSRLPLHYIFICCVLLCVELHWFQKLHWFLGDIPTLHFLLSLFTFSTFWHIQLERRCINWQLFSLYLRMLRKMMSCIVREKNQIAILRDVLMSTRWYHIQMYAYFIINSSVCIFALCLSFQIATLRDVLMCIRWYHIMMYAYLVINSFIWIFPLCLSCFCDWF